MKYGTISEKDLELFHFADSPQATMEILRESLTESANVAGPEVPAISSSAKPGE